MTVYNFLTPRNLILGLLATVSALSAPLAAADSLGDKANQLISSCPWIGLIAKEVTYGPITIGKLDIDGAGRLVFCQPGEKIEGTVRYKIDAAKLDSMHNHHIIVGIRDEDAQSCITHSLGVWDKKGTASFSFSAPVEKGVYEVCFDYHTAVLCGDALQKWHSYPPAKKTTIGIIVVE